MAKQFLTGLNLNKNELLNARIQNLSTAPSNPVSGQIYYDTDTNQLTVWNGTDWLALAAGGNVTEAINNAIDALDTDDIEEGSSNLYFTNQRALDATSSAYDASGAASTAESNANSYTDTAIGGLDTDDIEEGTTNLYFTAQRAADAVADEIDTAVSGAIDALDTDDIEEGSTNLYYTTARAKSDAADLLINSTQTNISITGDGDGLTITAENGVADSTTDDLTEGTTNKYYADSLVDSHLSGGDGITYSTGTISADLYSGGGLNIQEGAIAIDRTTVDTWYDASGAAGDVATDLSTHEGLTSGVHGTTGSVVGTSDAQTLTNKTISDSLTFNDGVGGNSTINATGDDLDIDANGNLNLTTGNGDIILNADGSEYIGSAISTNRIATRGHVTGRIDEYVGDNTVDGTTGNTITDRISAAQTAAEEYADGLASNYDPAGSAATALSDAQAYADGLVQGLNVKDSVRVATSVAGTLATDFDNGSTVGGVTVATGDRILIKDQSTATENGIYVVQASGAPVRATDADPVADELGKGSYVLVTNGTYAATGWVVTDYSAGATTWTQFSAANEYTAGDGIGISGNAISVALDSDSLSVSGSGLKANLNVQGGLDNDSGIFINTGTGLTVNGSNQLTFASGYGVRKYSTGNTALTASSGSVTWTVTHDLGTRDVTVQVFDAASYDQVEVDVVRTSTSVVTLTWVSGDVSADAYRVVVVG